MSRSNLSWLLGIAAVTLIGFSFALTLPGSTVDLKRKHENVSLIIDVMDRVERDYVKKLDDDQMREFVENMINGGLHSLDPHSSFFSAEEFERFRTHNQGKFGGVGIRIIQDPPVVGPIIVESPMIGTPAYKAGILAGDIIVKVDGKSTEGMTISDVAHLIQGEPGQKVVLTVRRQGEDEPIDITVTRAIIRIESVMGDLPRPDTKSKWEYVIDKRNGVAYVRVVAFTETTVQELAQVVRDLKKQGMKGLILDLRDNPGGLLRAAVGVASLFLPPGRTIVTTRGRNRQEEVFRSQLPPGVTEPFLDFPIAVLINRYSASASEIVAAALQDHFRAVIIGERSYGKGSVQSVIEMEGGRTALKLTTASYWRPSNKNIHRFRGATDDDEWGVKPNKGYEVQLTFEERKNYYKYRRERDVVRKDGKAPKTDFKDRVLEKALEYIHKELASEKGKKTSLRRPLPPVRLAPFANPSRPGLMARYPLIPVDDALYRSRAAA